MGHLVCSHREMLLGAHTRKDILPRGRKWLEVSTSAAQSHGSTARPVTQLDYTDENNAFGMAEDNKWEPWLLNTHVEHSHPTGRSKLPSNNSMPKYICYSGFA